MKKQFTLIIAALFLTAFYSSCKKDTSVVKKDATQFDQSALARQMATELYRSFTTQFNSNNQNIGGLKTSVNAGCGLVTTTPTNYTVVSGDTTRKYVGNLVFKTICRNDPWTVDAYDSIDTLKITETGPGFSNTYTTTQSYMVNGPASESMLILATLTAAHHLSKVNAQGVTTEFHDIATKYDCNPLVINPFAANNKIIGGRIEFTTQTVDLTPSTPTGVFGGYIGFIQYINNTARIYFRNVSVQGGYTRYILDYATGQMTGPVNTYPFPTDMN